MYKVVISGKVFVITTGNDRYNVQIHNTKETLLRLYGNNVWLSNNTKNSLLPVTYIHAKMYRAVMAS
jgi:hypothetical protein